MAQKILNTIVLVLLGIAVGTVGTIAHQATWMLGSATVPWAVVAALVVVACLLTGLRLLNSTRGAALAAAIGVLVAVSVFAIGSAGGSVLIPLNAEGIAWAIGPFVLTLIIVSWPRLRTREAASSAE